MDEIMLLKVLKHFSDNPYEEAYLRELSKKLKISPFGIKKYCDILLKENLISEERRGNLRYFRANTESIYLREVKVAFNIRDIVNSGIIEYISKNVNALSSVVLFGSMAKGENDINSDIDILVIGKSKNISFEKFENNLKREINYHLMSWTEWNKNFKNNKAFYYDIISHGRLLHGDMPLIKENEG